VASRTTSRTRATLAALLAAGVAAASIGAAASGSDEATSSKPPLEAAAVPAVEQAPAAVAASFGVFRRPVAAGDTLGTYGPNVGDFATRAGANLTLAQRVAQGQPGSRVWLVPADDAICLLAIAAADKRAIGPGGGCLPRTAAEQGMLVVVMGEAPQVEVAGVMPDGVKEVVVHLQDGSTTVAPVAANAYDVRVEQPTTAISWSDDAGKHELLAPSIDAE
jgi:hypothetical protein